jgi:hypothetical protein
VKKFYYMTRAVTHIIIKHRHNISGFTTPELLRERVQECPRCFNIIPKTAGGGL